MAQQHTMESAEHLRQRAEKALSTSLVETDDLSPHDVKELNHELQVHQIELEMQNEALRQAQTVLEKSRDQYADLYDFAPIGYLTLSEAGWIEEANLTMADWLGVERSQLLGRKLSDFVGGSESQDVAFLHFHTLLETGRPQRSELRLVRPDGADFYARMDSILRSDEFSQFRHIRSAVIDVTERKRAEEALQTSYRELENRVEERTAALELANSALQESDERLRFAIYVAEICYWIWNPQTDMLRWGGPHVALFDLESGESINTYEALVQRVHPLDRDSVRQTMESLRGSGTSPQLEFRIRRRDGSTRWVLVQAQAYQTVSSGPFCVLGVMQDITERKHSDQARTELLRTTQIASDLAEQTTQIKTQFLGMVSHELRTPLTSIKGFASTLLADDVQFDAQTHRQFLGIIDQETDKLVELVSQLLDLSQLQAGALKVNSVPTTLEHIFSLGRAQFQALTPHHQLALPVSLDFPALMADPVRITQVITNLISNAVKHSPLNSRIAVSARRIDRFVKISVSDQGAGIPPEKREKVFHAFEQLETKSNLATGVGLGLAICKSLIEAHGGQIWVGEQPTPGTTVSFTLPINTSA